MSMLHHHPQVLALLQAARERPEEDGPRLVLADWLEEHGDAARAESIRLQLLLAPGSSPGPERQAGARRRVQQLLAHFGGAWLGPLWRHGGIWHRGLLSMDLDRLRLPDHFAEMMPWTDTLHFEVPGRDALRWALHLLTTAGVNHATLRLRRPYPAGTLLTLLGEAPSTPSLRTLTIHWPPGMGLRKEEGVFLNLPEDFFSRLVTLLLSQSLTHLGSSFRFTEAQSRILRAVPIEPVLKRDLHWPHALPPAAFGRRDRPPS